MNKKEKVDHIVRAEYVLTMDDALTVVRDGAVAVAGGKVVSVGSYEEIESGFSSDSVVGGQRRALLPGLINTHTHAAMVYFRGLADDLPLKEWLEGYIWPAEGRWLSPQFVSDAVELACLEMLKAGVTTYADMYFFGDSAGHATKAMGMRAVLGAGIVDFPTASGESADDYLRNAERFIMKWKQNDLITPCIAAHSAYACSPETLRKITVLTDRLDVQRHIHLSETEWEVKDSLLRHGKRPVQHLRDIGFLDRGALAAHCVWVDDREIEILADMKVGVSHCLESNLKLASGIAPVVKMLKAGVKVTFGSDGAASNNDLDVISEMSTAAKLHKAVTGDPTALDARTALLMATRWGAEVLGLGSQVGSISPGKAADLVVIDLDKPHLTPIYDIFSHIVYALRPSDVETVLVSGKKVIDKGSWCCGNEEEILHKARMWGEKIRNA